MLELEQTGMERPEGEPVRKEIARGELAEKAGVDFVVRIAQLGQQLEGTRRLWRLRDVTTYTLLVIFALGNLATLALFFLNGLNVTSLSDVAMGSLAAATIAEVAGLLTIVMKGLFSGEGSS